MRKPTRVLAISAIAAAAIGTWSVVAVDALGPSPEELAADISEIDATILEAKGTAEKYAPDSLLGAQLAVQIAVLETTRAMLDQKRRSWLRGIDLTYVVDGQPIRPIDKESEAVIREEAAAAELAAAAAKDKASAYSGGLIQGMVLVEEQTHRTTLALINQRLALARLGMAMPTDAREPTTLTPIGRAVDDKGAL